MPSQANARVAARIYRIRDTFAKSRDPMVNPSARSRGAQVEAIVTFSNWSTDQPFVKWATQKWSDFNNFDSCMTSLK
jgi:hypothetical protein